MIFRAHYEFQTEEDAKKGHGSRHRAVYVFSAGGKKEALDDFRRWWLARNKALPYHFMRLCALKMCYHTISPIDKNDICLTGNDFHWYEWKADTLGRGPLPFPEPEKEGWR